MCAGKSTETGRLEGTVHVVRCDDIRVPEKPHGVA